MASSTLPDDQQVERSARTPEGGRWWTRLEVHAAALGLVLLALVPVFDSYAPAFPDEGLYSAQAALLADGSWSRERPAGEIDGDGLDQAMVDAVVDGDRAAPYTRRPAYPMALVPFHAALGSAGLMLSSVLGAWTAAVCAATLARRIDRRHAVLTLWLVGVGSPLLFGGYLVIGHAMAAGLAGLTLLGATRVLDDRARAWIAPTLLSAAGLVLVRSEGTIALLALVLAVAVMSVRRRPVRVDRRGIALAAALALVGVAAFVLNHVWAKAASSGLQGRTGSVVAETDALAAIWVNVLRPWYGDGRRASASMVVLVVALVLAALVLRAIPTRTLLPVALVCLAAVAAVARQFEQIGLVTGLVPAFPLVAAVLLLERRDLERPVVARLGLVSGATVVGVVLTVYGELDGAQWGGRFLYVALPALAPLVVLGLDHGRQRLPRVEARVAAVALVVITASMSTLSLRIQHDYRQAADALVLGSLEVADGVAGGDTLLVVTELRPSGTGRVFWRDWVDGRPLLQTSAPGALPDVLERAARTGRSEVVVTTDVGEDLFGMIFGDAIAEAGWQVDDLMPLEGTSHSTVVLVRTD